MFRRCRLCLLFGYFGADDADGVPVDAADGGDQAIGSSWVAHQFGLDERALLCPRQLAPGGVEADCDFAFLVGCEPDEEPAGHLEAVLLRDQEAVASVDQRDVLAEEDFDADSVLEDGGFEGAVFVVCEGEEVAGGEEEFFTHLLEAFGYPGRRLPKRSGDLVDLVAVRVWVCYEDLRRL